MYCHILKNLHSYFNTPPFDKIVGGYNKITVSAGAYYALAPITNGNTTYNIKIYPGKIISSTNVPVTINVNDATVTDGLFAPNGFSVSNSNIATLLADKLQVVNVNGTTTVKFKDDVANFISQNGNTYSYNDGTNSYTFTKNSDGTFTYNVLNTNGETISYNVAISPGVISTVTNSNVTVTVNDGKVSHGNFIANGYSVDNVFIAALLNGNLQVIRTPDDKTSVTVKNSSNLTNANGVFTYLAADGNFYSFTKLADYSYSYSVTNGSATTNYHVQIVPGIVSLPSNTNVPVTISLADGKISKALFTLVSDNFNDYTLVAQIAKAFKRRCGS